MILKNILAKADCEDEDEDEGAPGISILPADSHWGPDTLTFYGPESRAILISGPITQEQANCVISQMLELTSDSTEEPIFVYINTDGGEMVAGLAIYDMMRITPCPVVTLVVGACHSAGLFILQGGDRRGATPHASFFYHEPIGFNQAHNERASSDNNDTYKHLRSCMDTILQTRSKISKTVWKRDFEGRTAYTFDTTKALEYKLIDEVINYAKPKPLKMKSLGEI